MRLDGHRWNHKRVHRVYCAMRLNLPRRTKRRVPMRRRCRSMAPDGLNDVWSLDFVHDALYGGRRFRTLNVLDDGNREGLGIDVATSIPSRRVIRFMEQLIELHGKPDALRLDNGSELTRHAFVDWCASDTASRCASSSRASPIRTPTSSASTGPIGTKCSSAYVFDSIEQVQRDHRRLATRIQRGAASRLPRPSAAADLHAEGNTDRRV